MPKPTKTSRPKAAPPSAPRRAPGLELHPVADGYLVHQANGRALHRLNASAALVLELCDGRRQPAEIASLVQDAFGLARRPQAEVDAILREMAGQGLVSAPRAATGSQRRAAAARPRAAAAARSGRGRRR